MYESSVAARRLYEGTPDDNHGIYRHVPSADLPNLVLFSAGRTGAISAGISPSRISSEITKIDAGGRLSCRYSTLFPMGASRGRSACYPWDTTPTARAFLAHRRGSRESACGSFAPRAFGRGARGSRTGHWYTEYTRLPTKR